MLYEFKCRATGPVVMTQKVAERLLGIIGKETGPTDIILPAQMPGAIRALEAAIAAERERPQPEPKDAESGDEEENERDEEARRPVSLAQRAWPLIDMMKAAAAADREITWGA